MSGICGWLGSVEPAHVRATIERMVAPVLRYDEDLPRIIAGSRSALAVAGPARDTSVYHDGGILAGIQGDAYFTDSRLKRQAGESGPARAFADCYRSVDSRVQSLCGSFVLAAFDEDAGTALLAVDRIGTRPLFYALLDGCLVFASSMDAINLHPRARPELDAQGLYNYVHFHMVPGPGTAYRGYRRLLPGQALRYVNGAADVEQYWEMRFEENTGRPFPELKREFMEVLRDAVRRSARDEEVGTFLSGGTDSSTLAGLLGEVTGRPARTYSIGFEAKGYDEMQYARIAARHFGTRHHEYYVTPEDVVAAIPVVAAIHDQPFGNSSAVPTYYCAKLARDDGIKTLLGGDGGDELFGGNARYGTQYLYSLYSDLPEVLRKRVIEPLASLAPEVGLIGKAKRYMRTASIPMPERYDNYNLLDRLGADNVFTADFLAAVDRGQPQREMAAAYRAARAQSLINHMLALDLRYTLADNDLPKVVRSCELAGMGVRFPMLDDAVVAFSARLQPRLKLKGRRLRYFFKEALRGFLPEEIILKTKHGFGLPVGLWLQEHRPLRELVGDSLGSLKKRRIVRGDFLDELTGARVADHASYYGTMVWVLMMLEQWLANRPSRT